MRKSRLLIVLTALSALYSCGGVKTKTQSSPAEKATYKINTVAFYNLENLFDTEDDPDKLDEKSPIMEMAKSERGKIYRKKLSNMAEVISKIGTQQAQQPPAVIGVCEVENYKVLQDLVNEPPLKQYNYEIIHYESPDERSIDVALLYRSPLFRPMHSQPHEVVNYKQDDPGERDYTRDVLHVKGKLDGDVVHFFVNHWPSRSGGEKRSRPYRVNAAKTAKKVIDSVQSQNPYAKILLMGDLNDGPENKSVKEVINAKDAPEKLELKGMYNPFEKIFDKGIGTIAWRMKWDLFDHIIISKPLVDTDDYKTYSFYKAGVYNPVWLQNPRGRYKGYPYRAFVGSTFTGGYSDHFPVFIYLLKKVTKTTAAAD